MKEYNLIELTNGNRYIIVDMLNVTPNKYFLLAKINELYIDNHFNICIYDENTNSFSEIVEESEYNYFKEMFNNRLSELRKELEKIKITKPNILKLKVIRINGDNYTFEKIDGSMLVMNIEIYGDLKLKINDYIYIKEETTEENITVRFGSIYTDKTEIIKIISDNNTYYLQRYYG